MGMGDLTVVYGCWGMGEMRGRNEFVAVGDECAAGERGV